MPGLMLEALVPILVDFQLAKHHRRRHLLTKARGQPYSRTPRQGPYPAGIGHQHGRDREIAYSDAVAFSRTLGGNGCFDPQVESVTGSGGGHRHMLGSAITCHFEAADNRARIATRAPSQSNIAERA